MRWSRTAGSDANASGPCCASFCEFDSGVNNVSQALTAHGISNIVLRFDGNLKNYREWVQSTEKYTVLVNFPEARKKSAY